MTHGDERGLKLPPHIAPIQAVIGPVAAHKGGVMEKCAEIYDQLKAAGSRVKLDDRDTLSPGFKFNDWELKGVPVRVEIGPRDVENGQCVVFRLSLIHIFVQESGGARQMRVEAGATPAPTAAQRPLPTPTATARMPEEAQP